MLFRSCALPVLALLCVAPAARAAEPDGATVVLHLPASMSPEAVRGLIADLVAKGAQPRELPADPPAAGPPSAPTSADLAARIWEASDRAVRALPNLGRVPETWMRRAEADAATARDALGFWIIALAGLVAAPLIGRGVRRLFSQRRTAVSEPGSTSRLRPAVVRFFVSLAALAGFGVLFWIALLSVSSGRAIMEETADQLVWRALDWRLSIIVLMIVFSPGRPDLRLIA